MTRSKSARVASKDGENFTSSTRTPPPVAIGHYHRLSPSALGQMLLEDLVGRLRVVEGEEFFCELLRLGRFAGAGEDLDVGGGLLDYALTV